MSSSFTTPRFDSMHGSTRLGRVKVKMKHRNRAMSSKAKRTVALLGLVLLHQCAGYCDKDATKKKSLSVLLVPYLTPAI